LIGEKGEDEMEFFERAEKDHSELADVDKLFLQVIGKKYNYRK
jgi:hypothetical protein